MGKAAEQNNAAAQYLIGLIYFKEENYEQAFSWFNKSATQNYASAQYHLGLMYLAGWGASTNYIN